MSNNILPSNNITTELVRQTLNINTNDVGALCTNNKVNQWSKWKPTNSDCDTLTDDEIRYSNYSLNVVVANTPSQLLNYIIDNDNKGITYLKPQKYRLGDFRNYYHNAKQPITPLFADGDVVGLTNIANQPIITMSQEMNEYNVTMEDICKCYDDSGELQPLTRGVYLTNGTTSVWSTSTVYWTNPQWKKLTGDNVTVVEFLTNVPENTMSTLYMTQSTDRFFAIPLPLHTIKIDNSNNTTNPSTGTVYIEGNFEMNNDNSVCNYSFRFSSIGDGFVGGNLRNIAIKLSTDVNDTDVISYANIDDVTVGIEEQTPLYTGTLSNRYLNDEHKYYSGILYIHIYFNNAKQYTKAVLKLNV